MKREADEMPEEYKQNLAKLTEFFDDRERYRATIKSAKLRGVVVEPHIEAEVQAQLKNFDEVIEELERLLAVEYERIQAEKAKEAKMTELVNAGWESSKKLYIIVKHTTPHLLEKFTTQCLAPLTPEEREEFLDEVAILETTNLNAILKGED